MVERARRACRRRCPRTRTSRCGRGSRRFAPEDLSAPIERRDGGPRAAHARDDPPRLRARLPRLPPDHGRGPRARSSGRRGSPACAARTSARSSPRASSCSPSDPRTRAELAALLAPRWPDADPPALAHAVTFNAAARPGPAARAVGRDRHRRPWAPAEAFLGAPLAPRAGRRGRDGPALPRRLRPRDGRRHPHLVGAHRPAGGRRAPAPAAAHLPRRAGPRTARRRGRPRSPTPTRPRRSRFLPEYDNVGLSHADRARLFAGLGPGAPLPRGGRAIGTLLVDGFYRANWQLTEDAATATLTIDRFAPQPTDPPGTRRGDRRRGRGPARVPRSRRGRRRGAACRGPPRPGALAGDRPVQQRREHDLGLRADDPRACRGCARASARGGRCRARARGGSRSPRPRP